MPNGSEPVSPDASDPAQLWQQFVRDRDVGTRNRLIEHYLPLCRTIAAMAYGRRGGLQVEFVDYMQCATLGMIDAVQRFDPDQGVSFASFATIRIRCAILNKLDSLSEHYTQLSLRKRMEKERVESLSPRPEPGASRRRKGDLLGALAELTIGLALSHLLEGSGMLNSPDENPSYRQEFYEAEELRQLRSRLSNLVRALPEQERLVITYHYYHGLDFAEVARLFDLTRGRISQIHRQALQLIREAHGGVGRFNTRL